MYKKNTENYRFYIALSVIVILLLWIWMQNSAINSMKSMNDDIVHEISADGRYMATQRQNIMDLESALKYGMLEKERYMKNIKSKVTKNGFKLDTLETLNEFRVSIFDKKQGLFKKSVPVVEIKSNNPNTKVDKIKNVTIERKSPFFTKWWFIGSVGILLGHFLI